MTSKRKNIYFGAAILVLALLFGLAAATWNGAFDIMAAPAAQESIADTADFQLTSDQAEIAAVQPTQEMLARLYNDIVPSVVNIQVTMDATQADPGQMPFPFPFGEQGSPEGEPVVPQGEGSGFVFDTDGHIITNNHVVEDAASIVVYFHNGMWAEAELVARDPQADLAVLKVEAPKGVELKPLPLAAEDSLLPGYYVVAVGSPFGLDETMTLGVISAVGRSFSTDSTSTGSSYSLPDVIQTDTAINPGNSGGPLLNLLGEVVGVNFAINSPVRANSGVGFAIPVSVVNKVVPALIEDGAYKYAYLGIAGQTITQPVAEEYELPENQLGVRVGEVVRGGPADDAGIRTGDVIVGIDNAPVSRFEDLISYLFKSANPGSEVTLQVMREGQALELNVTLGERPEAGSPTAQSDERGQGGITIAEAINAAKTAVADAGLISEIESATAERDTQGGSPVWVVTLTGDGKTATVTVDAQDGSVLGLNVE